MTKMKSEKEEFGEMCEELEEIQRLWEATTGKKFDRRYCET